MATTKGRKPLTDDEKYPHCERCDGLIYCQPTSVDMNAVTGKADYHRSTPRYVKLCGNCCNELSVVVEKWLLKGGCKTKFQVKKNNA